MSVRSSVFAFISSYAIRDTYLKRWAMKDIVSDVSLISIQEGYLYNIEGDYFPYPY